MDRNSIQSLVAQWINTQKKQKGQTQQEQQRRQQVCSDGEGDSSEYGTAEAAFEAEDSEQYSLYLQQPRPERLGLGAKSQLPKQDEKQKALDKRIHGRLLKKRSRGLDYDDDNDDEIRGKGASSRGGKVAELGDGGGGMSDGDDDEFSDDDQISKFDKTASKNDIEAKNSSDSKHRSGSSSGGSSKSKSKSIKYIKNKLGNAKVTSHGELMQQVI